MSAEQDNYDAYGADYHDGQDGEEPYYNDDDQAFTMDGDETNSSTTKVNSTAVSDLHAPTGPRGVKRKESSEQVDASATTALLVSDLHWWTSEDDLRGWINEVDAEHDLHDISFNEHKVNGKSKGQAYLVFGSATSSSAAKHKIESVTEGSNSTRQFVVTFNSPTGNPFKTLPKDAPAKDKDSRYGRGGAYNSAPPRGEYGSGFRGRGRGYDRGGYNNQNFNRNFSGPGGSYNNNNGGFNNMGMMNNFGFNRGGMMNNNFRGMGGMRGGRGSMNNMMPMGMNMSMNPMMNGMGMQGFQGNNFAMFNQGGFGGDWSQPGMKRQRQE